MFSRNDTKALKGLAVIMMLFHHLAGFADRYPPDFQFEALWKPFIERNFLSAMAGFSNVCVSIFFFLGGYGLYLRWRDRKFSLIDNVVKLYRSYWRVLLVFIPVGLIFFRRSGEGIPSQYMRFVFPDLRAAVITILGDLTGMSSSINGEWWFFRTYLAMLPMGFLFCTLTQKNKSFTIDLLIVFFIDFTLRVIFNNLQNTTLLTGATGNVYFSNFLKPDIRAIMIYSGIVFAKHDGIRRIKAEVQKHRFSPFWGLLSMLTIFYLRCFVANEVYDLVYIPAYLIGASLLLDGIPFLKKMFCFLGARSTDMWLVHTFFCYYILEAARIVYITKSVWIDWFILIGMSVGASLMLDLFWSLIRKLCAQIDRVFPKRRPIPQREDL